MYGNNADNVQKITNGVKNYVSTYVSVSTLHYENEAYSIVN